MTAPITSPCTQTQMSDIIKDLAFPGHIKYFGVVHVRLDHLTETPWFDRINITEIKSRHKCSL